MENLFDSDWFGKMIRKQTNHLLSKADPAYDSLSHEKQNEYIKKYMTNARIDAVVDSMIHHSTLIVDDWAAKREQRKENLDIMLVKDTHDILFLAVVLNLVTVMKSDRAFLASVVKHCIDVL